MDFDQNRARPRKGSVALEKLGDLQTSVASPQGRIRT